MKRVPLKRRHPGSAAAGLRRAFRDRVLAHGGCVMCAQLTIAQRRALPADTTRLDAHHVIRAQTMKRHGLPPETVYHPLAGIPACRTCHSRHHAWVARIPRALVPAASVRFLTDLGLEADLDREYPPAAEAA